MLSAAENTTQERKHQKENLPQMSKLQICNHPLQKMIRHLHSPHKLKPSLNNSQKTPPLLSSSKKAKPARLSRSKTIPLLHCNHKTNPFLNNDNNTLLIHLHLAKTVPVHFKIMVKNSNCLQQKIPVPYQRNQDTVYIQNLIRFNQLCLFFSLSLYRSLHKYMSHIPCNFFKNFRFLVIYLLKCLFAFSFQYQSDAFIIFFLFSSHSFHTNLNLVHVSCSCFQFSFQFNSFKPFSY